MWKRVALISAGLVGSAMVFKENKEILTGNQMADCASNFKDKNLDEMILKIDNLLEEIYKKYPGM